MNKKIRKAVRTFLIKDDNIVVIKYKTEKNKDYFDIPGGKIVANETSIDASIREFKEETGIDILKQRYKGNVIIEYPNMIFDFDIYLVEKFSGIPKEFEENYSMWVNIEQLFNESNKFPSIEILKYLRENNTNLKIYSDVNHNIIKLEKKKDDKNEYKC